MSVAVVLSTFNERAYVDRALDAILQQSVSPEIVVVDGGSNDGTVERLHERAARDSRVRVVTDGVRRSLPEALNLAIGLTNARFVAKVDARTFVHPDFLEAALALLQSEGEDVACVGGRPEQYGETRFGEGLALARMSPFGVGGSGYASERGRSEVDTVQCGIYRRGALLRAGGFDPLLQFGEDEEANWRLRRAGLRIVRDPRIRFRYVARSSWGAAFRQYRNYGRARTQVWRKHPSFIRWHHFAPPVALAYATGLMAASTISTRARRMLVLSAAVYAAAAGVAATAAAQRRGSWSCVAPTMAAFTALHLGYGLGMMEGLLRPLVRRCAGTASRSVVR